MGSPATSPAEQGRIVFTDHQKAHGSYLTKLMGVLVFVGIVTAAVTTVSTAAHATSGDWARTSRAAALRACGDTRCGPITNVSANTSVQVWCWRDAGAEFGTNRWFRVSFDGQQGFVSANAMGVQPAVPYCSDMLANDRLFANQSVYSSNGRYRLVLQSDGNLVEYGPNGAIWSTMTGGNNGASFVQQGDGNGVVYSASNQPLWANMTMNSGARLAVQDDANIVTYIGSTPLYATLQHARFGQMRAAGSANPGASGNCTWWAEEQIKNYMRRGTYPAWGGNAGWWDDNAPSYGWAVQGMPTSHAIVVFEPNTNGASSLGHVAWADQVQLRGSTVWVHITEMNWVGYNKVSDRWIPHASGLSYIPAPSL
jgi:surface antigen